MNKVLKKLEKLVESEYKGTPFYGDWYSLIESIYKVNLSLEETFWLFFPDVENESKNVANFYYKFVKSNSFELSKFRISKEPIKLKDLLFSLKEFKIS